MARYSQKGVLSFSRDYGCWMYVGCTWRVLTVERGLGLYTILCITGHACHELTDKLAKAEASFNPHMAHAPYPHGAP